MTFYVVTNSKRTEAGGTGKEVRCQYLSLTTSRKKNPGNIGLERCLTPLVSGKVLDPSARGGMNTGGNGYLLSPYGSKPLGKDGF